MSLLEVMAVPFAVLVILALLLLTEWIERHILSSRSMITAVVRVRNTPEHAERVVAAHAERLLSDYYR